VWIGPINLHMAKALPAAEIVGVDSSIDMIGKAAARDATESWVRERVSLVEGDMRDWPRWGEPFHAVGLGCCSVSHLLTLDDRCRN
jgi:ubiquinone/menaquinone biosynthesis C-methylase UbiE